MLDFLIEKEVAQIPHSSLQKAIYASTVWHKYVKTIEPYTGESGVLGLYSLPWE